MNARLALILMVSLCSCQNVIADVSAPRVTESQIVLPIPYDGNRIAVERIADVHEVEGMFHRYNDLHSYRSRARTDELAGEIFVSSNYKDDWLELSWDLTEIRSMSITVMNEDAVEYIAVTPVFFDALDRSSGETAAPELVFGDHAFLPNSLVAALRLFGSSPELKDILPEFLSVLVPNEADLRKLPHGLDAKACIDKNNLDFRGAQEWGCGIVCGGVIGMGWLTVVSGGVTTPGLIMGAASCGSCMGFIWGQPPTAQSITLGPETTGHVASILPVLPPNWYWSCESAGGGKWTCTAREFPEDPH